MVNLVAENTAAREKLKNKVGLRKLLDRMPEKVQIVLLKSSCSILILLSGQNLGFTRY